MLKVVYKKKQPRLGGNVVARVYGLADQFKKLTTRGTIVIIEAEK